MRELKYYIKNYTPDIMEGLLDDIESTVASGDDYIHDELFTKWSNKSSNKPRWFKKKRGYVIFGDYKITNIDEKKYTGPKIKTVNGNLTIMGTSLESLEDMFDVDCEINGTFAIEDNPNLKSLKGCPIQCNTLIISGNKNLKDIDVAPHVLINAYISKNGKKFDKETLKGKINVYKNIFCSFEDEEVMIDESEKINEVFKAPQLKILMDKIKSINADSKSDKFRLNHVAKIAWDKVNASDFKEYDSSDPKALTAARKLISCGANAIYGLCIFIDKDGAPMGILKNSLYYNFNEHSYEWETKSYIQKKLTRFNYRNITSKELESIVKKSDSLLILNLNDTEHTDKLKYDRASAQSGAIGLYRIERDKDKVTANNVRYYQDIADDNRKRYKEMLIKLKAERATNQGNFDKFKIEIDKLFQRYTALLAKMIKNPSKYYSYDLTSLNNAFMWAGKESRRGTIHTSGLMVMLSNYFSMLSDASRGKNYYYVNDDIETRIKNFENNLEVEIQKIDIRLKRLEQQ